MRHEGWKFLALMICMLLWACGGDNYFSQMASKNSDEALYTEALKLVDQRAYDEALAMIQQMTPNGRSRIDVVQTTAGIYAGKCGLDFLDFASNIGGSSSLFGIFMSGFQGVSVNMAHCQTAQNMIEDNFGETGVQRTARLGAANGSNVNIFMAILGMTKIGAQLRSTADINGTGGNGDGIVDGSFNACQAGSISNAQIGQVGTGFALILDNFTAIASSLSGSNSVLLADLEASCSSLGGTNPCTITDIDDPAWADAIVLTAIRALIRSQDVGIQSCLNNGTGLGPHPFNCCP